MQDTRKTSERQVMIYITTSDYHRLSGLIEMSRERNGDADREYLDQLEEELGRAELVNPKEIPADVITMRSKVSLKDLKSGQTVMYSLVFPSEANSNEGHISVLAPIGTALLGNRSGDVVESRVPSGLRRLKVKEILYQPEAAGNYNE
jgi:regulator of nucleoside diphosphate kinase